MKKEIEIMNFLNKNKLINKFLIQIVGDEFALKCGFDPDDPFSHIMLNSENFRRSKIRVSKLKFSLRTNINEKIEKYKVNFYIEIKEKNSEDKDEKNNKSYEYEYRETEKTKKFETHLEFENFKDIPFFQIYKRIACSENCVIDINSCTDLKKYFLEKTEDEIATENFRKAKSNKK